MPLHAGTLHPLKLCSFATVHIVGWIKVYFILLDYRTPKLGQLVLLTYVLEKIVLPWIKEREQGELSVTLQKGRKRLRKTHFLPENSGTQGDLHEWAQEPTEGPHQAAQNGGVSDDSGGEKMKRGNNRGREKGVEAAEVRMFAFQAGCNRW